MSNVKKEERADEMEIRKLNYLGIGQRAIGKRLGCHAATVKFKLDEMGIEPIDTRYNFMETIYDSLSREEQDWLADNLYTQQIPIKEFITRIIKEAYKNAPVTPVAEPTPLPVAPSYPMNDQDYDDLASLSKLLSGASGVPVPTTGPVKNLFEE